MSHTKWFGGYVGGVGAPHVKRARQSEVAHLPHDLPSCFRGKREFKLS